MRASGRSPSLLAEQRRGWSLMIFLLAQRAVEDSPRWTRAVEDNQPPSLKREQASLEGACIKSFDARSKGQPRPLP